MQKHGNYQIYNRQIYGILYHDTLGKIKYEYQDYVRERVKEMFASSLKYCLLYTSTKTHNNGCDKPVAYFFIYRVKRIYRFSERPQIEKKGGSE